MSRLTNLLVTMSIFVLLTRESSAQEKPRIFLIQRNSQFYNSATGASTSDWRHEFMVEGENTFRKAGFFGQHLRKYVQSDSVAVGYINQYATRQAFKLATSVSTVVLVSIFGISNVAQKNTPENPNPPTLNTGLLYVAGATFIANLILRIVPPRCIFKAVDSYNQSIGKKDTGFAGVDLGFQNAGPARQVTFGIKFNL
jgi:hypothetical protein